MKLNEKKTEAITGLLRKLVVFLRYNKSSLLFRLDFWRLIDAEMNREFNKPNELNLISTKVPKASRTKMAFLLTK